MTQPHKADPNIRWAPTIYTDDPPAVVDFLTHTDDDVKTQSQQKDEHEHQHRS